MTIRSLLEHVGIDVGDLIFINGQLLEEPDYPPAGEDEFIEFDCS